MSSEPALGGSSACAQAVSERQSNGFLMTDTLDTLREQQFDRLGTSVIGTVSCKADVSTTNPICTMKTPAHTLLLAAHHDRHQANKEERRSRRWVVMFCWRAPGRHDANIVSEPSAASFDIILTTRDPWAASGAGGQIQLSVHSDTVTARDLIFDWFTGERQSALLNLNEERSGAHEVPPGVYVIRVVERKSGLTREYTTSLSLAKMPSVVEYVVTHASSDTARDGTVVAHLENVDQSEVRFLWTSGVVTIVPELHDVRPGTYMVTPMSTVPGEPLVFVHACAPASVRPSRVPIS